MIIIFMFLSGINFTLHFIVSHGELRKALRNEELRFYTRIILAFTLVIFIILYSHGTTLHKSFRDSLFQVVSIVTCTGFATADYLLWPATGWFLIFVAMFVGASAGSTGGGIKVVRHLLMILFGVDFLTSIGGVATSMGGIGPGLGTAGPASNFFHLPFLAKFLLTLDMLIGRLEIYAFLVLFSPAFWKR